MYIHLTLELGIVMFLGLAVLFLAGYMLGAGVAHRVHEDEQARVDMLLERLSAGDVPRPR